ADLPLERGDLEQRMSRVNAATKLEITRERTGRSGRTQVSVIDLKEHLEALTILGEDLHFTLGAPHGQCLSPYLVLEAVAGARHAGELVPMEKTGFNLAERQSPPSSSGTAAQLK